MVVTTDLFGAGNVYPLPMLLIHPWSPEQNRDSHPPGCFFFARDFIVFFLDSDRQRRQPPGLATHDTCLRAVDRDLGCMLGAGNEGGECMKTRTEHDSLGSIEVPATALYGAQTQRAAENFGIAARPMPVAFIQAVCLIKREAAAANAALGAVDSVLAEAIRQAAEEVLAGSYAEQFPVDVYQTGSGTSTNMNVNEVLAHRASALANLRVHPNDHVNA